jgi:hypothetical protein
VDHAIKVLDDLVWLSTGARPGRAARMLMTTAHGDELRAARDELIAVRALLNGEPSATG